jgi:hypothetical protein
MSRCNDEVLIFAVVFDVCPLHLIVPERPNEKLEVTKRVRVKASKARRWFRGWEALPIQDSDRYVTQVPRQDTFFFNDPHLPYLMDAIERESLDRMGVEVLTDAERRDLRKMLDWVEWAGVEHRMNPPEAEKPKRGK